MGSVNRPFSYSGKGSQPNDTLLHIVEFSKVHDGDKSSNATQSNLACKNVYIKIMLNPGFFAELLFIKNVGKHQNSLLLL